MALRCSHGLLRGLCTVPSCPHWDGLRSNHEAHEVMLTARRRPANANESRGDASRFAHPGFQDVTGQRFGHLVVESRAPNVNGNARWRCVCDCGGRCVVAGIVLRAGRKKGADQRCPTCRPKRPGTVKRRTGS